MTSDYILREKCAKAIATKVAKRAFDYVSDDLVECCRKMVEVQADFNDLAQRAASDLMAGHKRI